MIYLVAMVLFRAALALTPNPLRDGYHTETVWWWEELYLLVLLIPETYILAWVTSQLLPPSTSVVPYLEVSYFAVVLGALLAVRFVPVTLRTLENSDGLMRLPGLYTTVLFGIGFSTSLAIATHPNEQQIQEIFGYHLTLAFNFLEQFQSILGLDIPALPSVAFEQSWAIFLNNLSLSATAGALGVVGGVLVIGIPLLLIMAVNAGVLFGAFAGILIRNTIATGGLTDAVVGPTVGYLSSLGLLVAGHTFYEFFAIVSIGVAGAAVGVTVWRGLGKLADGLRVGVAGVVLLGAAAFLEVFVSAPVINQLTGYLVVESRIVPVDGSYGVGVVSTVLTTGAFMLGVAWMTSQATEVVK